MKSNKEAQVKLTCSSLVFLALFLVLVPVALASDTWYVDGVNGLGTNDCKSPQTACKTIAQAISLANVGYKIAGDTIMVSPATYTENLTIDKNLKIFGSDAATTIIDGNQAGSVFSIPDVHAHARLSKLTIRNGSAEEGGGIGNSGTLAIDNSIISGNYASYGGGIRTNGGTLTIRNSTIRDNVGQYFAGGIALMHVASPVRVRIDNCTFSGNQGYYGGAISTC